MRVKLLVAVGALLALGGCVAYPVAPAYYGPPRGGVVVQPAPYYSGGYGYGRGYYGGRGSYYRGGGGGYYR